jgi:hypothetical protein
MGTQLNISSLDPWMAGAESAFIARDTVRENQNAPEERNHIAKGIIYSLPISALLWCGLIAMLLHR